MIIYRYTLLPPHTKILLPDVYKILKVGYSVQKEEASIWILLDKNLEFKNEVTFVPIPTGVELTKEESLLTQVGMFDYIDSFETTDGLVFHVFTNGIYR